MNSHYEEELIRIGIAFLTGGIIGMEREYRSKPAGIRTMIMICVGSALFTILSKEISDISPDRIASNIVTGIGFIGAGVIFKEGLSINGLTTAALIWVTAALGMAAGLGNFVMVGVVLVVVLFTLFILQYLQDLVDRTHTVTVYKIKYAHHGFSQRELETHFKQLHIRFTLIHIEKEAELISITYRIISNIKIHQELNDYFINNNAIHSFTV